MGQRLMLRNKMWGIATLALNYSRLSSPLCFVLLIASSLQAEPIYVYKEADGAIRFTNKPPPQGITAQVFTAKASRFSIFRGIRNFGGKLFRTAYQDLIDKAADTHRLDKNLIRAVIHVESGFNPQAVSPKGARGLMQLMPEIAKILGVKDSFVPAQNIEGGTKHLALLIRRYSGNLKLALAAYNAGEEAVNKYNGIPPFRETQDYVERVVALHKRYQAATSS